jgi:hypothetical protein
MWAKIRLDRHDQVATARRTLEMLYRYGKTHWVDFLHRLELLSFYEENFPCRLLDRLDLHDHEHEIEFDAVLQGAFYRLKGTLDEAASYLYRKYFTDGISPLYDWELMVGLDDSINLRSSARSQVLAWAACQAVSTYGSKHPKALFHLGNYAHSLHLVGDDESALAWYQWLLAARRRVQGELHPATAGAMLGIARASISNSCQVAIDAATRAYDTRLYALGPDDYLTQNARNALDEMEDQCEGYLEDHENDTLSIWKMKHMRSHGASPEDARWPLRNDDDPQQAANIRLARAYLTAGRLDDGTAILLHALSVWSDVCERVEPGLIYRGEPGLIYTRQFAADVINRYSRLLTPETIPEFSNLTAALEQLWHSCNPHEHPHPWEAPWYSNHRACLRLSISLSLSLLSQMSGSQEMAGHWLSRVYELLPEWFAHGSCDYYGYYSENGSPRLPHVYLYDVLFYALGTNHRHSWIHRHNVIAVESVVDLVLSRMVFSEPSLGATLSLSGWDDFGMCSNYNALSLRNLDILYGGKTGAKRRCPLNLDRLMTEARKSGEEDKSESCFQDTRRFSMCRAS